jgi:uncharacterized membrane protein
MSRIKKNKQPATNSGLKKLLFSTVLAVGSFAVLSATPLPVTTRLILAWDVLCITMLAFSWVLFARTNEDELSSVVEAQDDGLKAIFTIVLVAVCFSFLGAILLLGGEKAEGGNKILQALVSLSPVILSWTLLHTIFTMRYAHLYHDKNQLKTGTTAGGVEFPGKDKPDYLDFAYFSFVIGMTFQVSDVQISSRVIRRFVLFHSIISFVFNTIIVALTINAIAGLTK